MHQSQATKCLVFFPLLTLSTLLKTIPSRGIDFISFTFSSTLKLVSEKMKMVAKICCILFIAVLCESKKSLVPQAIFELVQSYYGERRAVIEVFYIREVKILDETLKLLKSEKQLIITEIDMDHYVEIIRERQSDRITFMKDAIFLFDTMKNYRKFLFLRISDDFEFNHLVYFEDASKKSIQKILQRHNYRIFLLVENDQISLQTMTMYTKTKCRAVQLVEINKFFSLERKWKTEKFFRPRIEHFHGCKLTIAVDAYAQLPFVQLLTTENGTETAEGAIVDMIEALSTHLNFTTNYTKAEIDTFISLNYDLTITSGLLSRLGRELYVSSSGLSSDAICTFSDVFVVPPGALYTSWEKLLLPFDWATWMWLGITFATAFLVILVIKVCKSTSMYEFIIGCNVATPSLNVVAIFMGIGQILIPQRNVTRFLFMNFILFSLIMRTAYQGKYFEFLTSEMRKKRIQTIEELNDKNFTIILETDYYYNYREDLEEEG